MLLRERRQGRESLELERWVLQLCVRSALGLHWRDQGAHTSRLVCARQPREQAINHPKAAPVTLERQAVTPLLKLSSKAARISFGNAVSHRSDGTDRAPCQALGLQCCSHDCAAMPRRSPRAHCAAAAAAAAAATGRMNLGIDHAVDYGARSLATALALLRSRRATMRGRGRWCLVRASKSSAPQAGRSTSPTARTT